MDDSSSEGVTQVGKGHTDTVPLEARYAAAWDEIHARVEARQNIRIQFAVVAVGSAVAALSGVSRSDWLAAWTFGLALAMPFLTWAFALWTRHADLTIGLLSRYCGACESLGDETNTLGLPGWNRSDQGWMTEARRLGRLSDGADILLVILTSFPAIGLCIGSIMPVISEIDKFPWWVPGSLLVAQLSAVPFVWRKRARRARIAALEFRKTADGWKVDRTR